MDSQEADYTAERPERLVELGRRLRRLVHHERKQVALARSLRISESSVSSWLAGTRRPSYHHLFATCLWLRLTESSADGLLRLVHYPSLLDNPRELKLYNDLAFPELAGKDTSDGLESSLVEIRDKKSRGQMEEALQVAYSVIRHTFGGDPRKRGLVELRFDAVDEALHINTFITPSRLLIARVAPLFARARALASELDNRVIYGRIAARRGDTYHIAGRASPALRRRARQDLELAPTLLAQVPETSLYPAARANLLEKGEVSGQLAFESAAEDFLSRIQKFGSRLAPATLGHLYEGAARAYAAQSRRLHAPRGYNAKADGLLAEAALIFDGLDTRTNFAEFAMRIPRARLALALAGVYGAPDRSFIEPLIEDVRARAQSMGDFRVMQEMVEQARELDRRRK